MPTSAASITRSFSFRLVSKAVGLAWYVLLVGAAVAVIFVLAFVFADPTPLPAQKGYAVGGLTLSTTVEVPIDVRYEYDTDPYGEHAIPPAVLAGQQVLVDGFDGVRLRLQDAYGAAYGGLAILFCIGLGLGVVWQLRELCTSIAAREPFCEANGARLRRIGIMIIAGSVVYTAVSWAMADLYLDRVDLSHGVASVRA